VDVESFLPTGINQMQTMKLYTMKIYLIALGFAFVIPAVNAQFDDVYYDPDNTIAENDYNVDATDPGYSSGEEVTYYDNDEYEYYDDYDYYYSSRIKLFYRPSFGSGFYDPYYVDSYNYDPFYSDSYYYPGSTIYLSFGNSSYWDYRHWRRWNQWNSYNPYNNWCLTPSSYYYAYNSWCSPSYNYWGGYNGYYSYSNYYNNYYNSCPSPISNYNGITHTTITTINSGGTRGTYYGPRITGNTGSSPRGPVVKPESVQPVSKGNTSGLTDNNDKPREVENGSNPGGINTQSPILPGTDRTPDGLPVAKDDNSKGVTNQIPIDKELKREETSPTPQRPVFRPEADKYKPYPTNERTNPTSDRPTTDKPTYNPSTPSRENYSTPDRSDNTPNREGTKPSYNPNPRGDNERPSYSPPQRNKESSGNDSKPSYSPSPRRDESKSNDRPGYQSPQRNNDSGRSNDSGKSNDRPSYSPPSSRDNSSGGSSSHSQPSRSSSPSSSGGSPRSSGRGN